MNGSSWDFTLANYDAVWAFMVQFGLLLFFLMVGNILRRKVKIFRTGSICSFRWSVVIGCKCAFKTIWCGFGK